MNARVHAPSASENPIDLAQGDAMRDAPAAQPGRIGEGLLRQIARDAAAFAALPAEEQTTLRRELATIGYNPGIGFTPSPNHSPRRDDEHDGTQSIRTGGMSRTHARGGRTLAFNDAGDFAAYHRMRREMTAAGFSIGSSERGKPLGVLFGDFEIAKWRNMNAQERSDLHGVVEGDRPEGPVLVTIFDDAPSAARKAFGRMIDDRLAAAYQSGDPS